MGLLRRFPGTSLSHEGSVRSESSRSALRAEQSASQGEKVSGWTQLHPEEKPAAKAECKQVLSALVLLLISQTEKVRLGAVELAEVTQGSLGNEESLRTMGHFRVTPTVTTFF